ncbi:hypothetical protein PIB30_096015, partial [Stylosanthes scabra]|nr:hypothetical protein [Stylosanthes scabra]
VMGLGTESGSHVWAKFGTWTLSVEMGELGMSGLPHVWVKFGLGQTWAWPNVALRWCWAGYVFALPKTWVKLGSLECGLDLRF